MKITILGGNGILGPPTIKYLLEYTNADINVVTDRPENIPQSERVTTFPHSQMTQAMALTDVVYNFLGILADWNKCISAISASGASLYFLPDFGIRHEQRPDFEAMARKTNHYEQAAKIPNLKCVRLLTGAFIDTMVQNPHFWGVDLANKTATSVGNGSTKFSYTFVDKIALTLALAATVDITKLDNIMEIKNGDICLNEFYKLLGEALGADLTVSQGMTIEDAEKAIFNAQQSNPQGADYAALYGLTVVTLCNAGYGVISNKDNWIASQKNDKWINLNTEEVRRLRK